jgi:maleate cis-trans isomerase
MTSPVRLGLIVPAANTTVETEFPKALEGRATVHFQRFSSSSSA